MLIEDINKKNLIIFGPPTELGYYCENWDELFFIFRQPSLECTAPYLCASFRIKEYSDCLDIIMGNNGIAVCIAKSLAT
jgi:hypothetical protein